MTRPAIGVFLILWASYAFFWHGRDWNTASRLMLTYAIVDRGTIRLDGLDDQTGDKARYKNHTYSDKLPGLSILAVPPYALAKLLLRLPDHPLGKAGFAYWPADYWVTLFTSGLATALTGAMLTSLSGSIGCGPRRAILIGLAYGLATPAYAYATLAYGHQASAACLFGSFALLWREPRGRVESASGLAGFLAAYASVIELQVGPVSAILGLYALALAIGGKRPWAGAIAFGLGAVGPTLILLGYNFVAFDSPFRMGYFYHVIPRFKDVHSIANPLGLSRPDWSRLNDLLLQPARGLFWYAPILMLAVPGLVVLGVRRHFGMVAVCSGTIGAVVLVNLSYPEWTGGWSTGPRLLVPMLPFAMLGVTGLLGRGGRGPDLSKAGLPIFSSPLWRGQGEGGVARINRSDILTRSLNALALALALAGWAIITLFQGVGARIPDPLPTVPPGMIDPLAHPLTQAVWPIWAGERLPGWVFGHRFARTILAPTDEARLADSWKKFLPLFGFQAVATLVLILSCGHPLMPPRDPLKPGPTPPTARPDRP